jgi:hypothetical protein
MTDGISEQERRALFARVATGSASARRTPIESPASVANLDRSRRRFGWTGHLHKIALIGSFLLVSNRMVLSIIGALNRRLFSVRTVFLVYPGSDEILKRYSYGVFPDWVFWRPTLIGVYNQAGSWGLVFAIARTESDFDQPDSTNRLKTLHARMESIRRTIGASDVRFAGVLPGRLYADGLATSESEANAAVTAVLNAELIVRHWEGIDAAAPIIVLGANGFVGQRLISKLAGRNVHAVDVGSSGSNFPHHGAWPTQFIGKRTLLINVARAGTLTTLTLYLDLLWSSLVILNEAYPAPLPKVLEKLGALNCRCYHIAGAVGDSYPDFPWPYAGAIPCCAAQITDQTAVVVKRLV